MCLRKNGLGVVLVKNNAIAGSFPHTGPRVLCPSVGQTKNCLVMKQLCFMTKVFFEGEHKVFTSKKLKHPNNINTKHKYITILYI